MAAPYSLSSPLPELPEKWQHPRDATVLMARVPEDLRLMAEFRVRAAILPGTASPAVQHDALQTGIRLSAYAQTYDKPDLAPNLIYSADGLSNAYADYKIPERVHDYMRHRLDQVIPLLDELGGLAVMEKRSVGVLAQHRRVGWHRDPDRAVFVDTIIGNGTRWMLPDADRFIGESGLSITRRSLSRLFAPFASCAVPENAGIIFNVWREIPGSMRYVPGERLLHRSHNTLLAPRFAYGTAHIEIKF